MHSSLSTWLEHPNTIALVDVYRKSTRDYWNDDVAILHVRRRLSRHLLAYAVGHVTVDRELWVTVSQSSTNELWIYSSTKSQCVTGSGD